MIREVNGWEEDDDLWVDIVDDDEKDESRVRTELTEQHDLDEDACCVICGFDAAEWWHLERHKPKEERERQPECTAEGKPGE
jgi:hypothetical protein